MRQLFRFLIFIIIILFAFFFPLYTTSAQSVLKPFSENAPALCGDGSEADNYGFSYNLQQPHWTVGWENYVSENTINQVDAILDRLNNDNVAQTMILFKPQNEVGNRVNCAVHFLRYMQLGQPEGERKDNGFVFLIVVESNKIDVHYGVGLGLPALTAPELTNLNRLMEDSYQSSHNMDEALLSLVKGFDEYSRSKYTPLILPTPTSVYVALPTIPNGPAGIGMVCCLVFVGIILLIVLVKLSRRMGGILNWIFFILSFFSSGGNSSSWPDSSSGDDSPIMRGGSGSGRSRRGN